MRTHHIITLTSVWGLAACGGSSTDLSPSDDKKVETVAPDPTSTSGSLSDPPTLPEAGVSPPTSSGSGSAGSGSSGAVDPPTLDAGTPATSGSATSGATSGSPGSGGAMVGGSGGSGSTNSGSMSGANAGSSGSVADPLTCSGVASQACGNCQSGTSIRTCTDGVWGAWGTCTGATSPDLSLVGTGDFTVSFDLTDTDTSYQSVVSQRHDCSTPSLRSYWDVHLNATTCFHGGLTVETFDTVGGLNTHCAQSILPQGVVATSLLGDIHHVILHRTSGVITFTVDTTQLDSWADTTNLHPIGTALIGTDVCDGTDGLVGLNGTLSNVCVEKQ